MVSALPPAEPAWLQSLLSEEGDGAAELVISYLLVRTTATAFLKKTAMLLFATNLFASNVVHVYQTVAS